MKLTTIAPLVLFIFLTLNIFSFWYGIHVGLSKTIATNAQFIQSQKDVKESLASQLLYIENLNAAHEQALEIERPK